MSLLKSLPKYSSINYLFKLIHNWHHGKNSPKISFTSTYNFQNTAQSKQLPNRRKVAQSGHPVSVLSRTFAAILSAGAGDNRAPSWLRCESACNAYSVIFVDAKKNGWRYKDGWKRTARGRCFDHNFLRFLTIFNKNMAFFSKTNVTIKFLNNLALFWDKNAIFLPIFTAKIFKKS
jgi:hypothetical protein